MSTYPAEFVHVTIQDVFSIPLPPEDAELACDWGNPEACQDDNTLRAELAGLALRAYAERTGSLKGEPVETVLGDLFNDLRHLCDALDLDFDGLAGRDLHYAAELRGEF